jgi:hypothetical protein
MPDNETKTPASPDGLDLLNEFASGEDEFDVDLMASGCRLATSTQVKLSMYDLVKLHNLDFDRLLALLGAVIDETNIDTNKLFQLAEKAGRAKFAEASRPSNSDTQKRP